MSLSLQRYDIMLQCNLKAIVYTEVKCIVRSCTPLPAKNLNPWTNRYTFFTSFCPFPQNDPFKNDVRTSINYPLKQQRLDKCSNGCFLKNFCCWNIKVCQIVTKF